MDEAEQFFEKHWLYIAGAVIAYFAFKKLMNVAAPAVDKTASIISDAYIAATQPAAVGVNASIMLPGGQIIDANAVTLNDALQFRYGGILYRVDHRDENNNYVAVTA